jgi:hypothetical protein
MTLNKGDNIDSEDNIDSKDNIDKAHQKLQKQIIYKNKPYDLKSEFLIGKMMLYDS